MRKSWQVPTLYRALGGREYQDSHQSPGGDPQAWFVLSRMVGTAPGSHSLDGQPHSPEHQLSLSPGPWEAPPAEEVLKSELRPVSRTYLNSLKNKLISGTWRKSCQPGAGPGPEAQVRSGSQGCWLWWGMGRRAPQPSIPLALPASSSSSSSSRQDLRM